MSTQKKKTVHHGKRAEEFGKKGVESHKKLGLKVEFGRGRGGLCGWREREVGGK